VKNRGIGNGFLGDRTSTVSTARSLHQTGIGAAMRAFVGFLAAVPVLLALCAPASADFLVAVTQCGALIRSTVKQGVDAQQTIAVENAYVTVVGAGVVVNVPTGRTRCVRVRFSTNLVCIPPNSTSRCFVKVYDDLTPLLWGPAVSIATDEPGGAHSYEWVARLSAGKHTLRIQASKNSGVSFVIAHWALAVDVAQ